MVDQDSSTIHQAFSREIWNQARRKAFWERLSATLGLSRGPATLIPFEEVQQKLRLNQSAYRGLQQVPLDQIVGSVGRYHDFTRTFLPLIESDSARWRRIAELQMETGLPPIELYKVGDAYFVKDGNHRVSVARQFGMSTIEAYVWEYESKTGGISAEGGVDELIVKAEYRAFLDRTRLDITRPEAQIILTEPGMYPALELEIELFRENLNRIDGEPHSYQDAAATWYDLVYSLAVDVIHESGVLEQFPGRTEADLYVWVSRHRRDLAERYGGPVSLRDAVAKIAEGQQRSGPVGWVVRSVAGLVSSLAGERGEERAPEDLVLPPDDSEPLGKLLSQMRQHRPVMAYAGQRGAAWRQWRQDLHAKLIELLQLDYTPTSAVSVEEGETSLISGVLRTSLRIEAGDGLWLPAYRMAPVDQNEPLPGLIVFAGHGTIRQTAGLVESAHRSNALALAQAGYVTLTIEARGVGELGQADHVTLDNVARLIGRSWLAMVLEDGLRGIDYLRSLPIVKADRLGATGLGLGGGLALYLAALDERIRALVVQHYLGGGIDPLAVQGHGCDFVPGLWRWAQLSDVARLVVPRPALYVYSQGRSATHIARSWFDRTRPAYEQMGCPDRTNFVEGTDGVRYYRRFARNWFERWLVEEEDTSVLLWAPRE